MRSNFVRLAAAVLAVLLLPLPHAAAQAEVYKPCDNTSGKTVVKVGTSPTFNLEKPLPVEAHRVPLGPYVIDLAGLNVGQTRMVTFTLAWQQPIAGGADYDMTINGKFFVSTRASEVALLASSHCQVFSGEYWRFGAGLPTDTLTLTVKVPR